MAGTVRKTAAAALAVLMATMAAAQDSADAAQIEGVIGAQLDAFNARDVGAAWEYASPMIQGIFGTPSVFGQMVETGYPMVWTNSDVEYLGLRVEGPHLFQRIALRGPDGMRHLLDYEMVETPDGWEINGVFLVPPTDVGV